MATLQEATICNIRAGIGNSSVATNTVLGYAALSNNSTGLANTAIGCNALNANTSARGNTGFGEWAGKSITSNGYNTAIGARSLRDSNTLKTTAFGAFTSQLGSYSVAIGEEALNVGYAACTVGIGFQTLKAGGTRSTGVGFKAIKDESSPDMTSIGALSADPNGSGGNSTVVGFYTARFAGGSTNRIDVGWYAYSHFGYYTSNVGSLGRYGSAEACIYSSWVNVSDSRDKANVTPIANNLGLNFIRKLKPVSYVWDHRQSYVNKCGFEYGQRDGTLKQIKEEYGFLAQEIEQALTELGTRFDGLHYDSYRDAYTVTYEEFIAPIVKALQEINTEIDELENQIIP